MPTHWLDSHGSNAKRVAIPAPVAWRLALLAMTAPSATIRTRLTAVVAHYFSCRRAKDILSLAKQDVQILPDGGASFQICRAKTDAKRHGGGVWRTPSHLLAFHTSPTSL